MLDRDGKLIQPAWFIETKRAQTHFVSRDNKYYILDNTTGKCYIEEENRIDYDGEIIPVLIETVELDGGIKGNMKYSTDCKITGSWGSPFWLTYRSYPQKTYHTKQVYGYGHGTPLGSNPYSNFKYANTESIWKKVKFKKLLGNAYNYEIKKFDYDATFNMESIESGINIVRGRR